MLEREKGLKLLGDLAAVLDSQGYTDSLAPVQKRAIRSAADELRDGMSGLGLEVNAQTVLAVSYGATAMEAFSKAADPLQAVASRLTGGGFNTDVLLMAIAHLARDLLAGERVE